MIEKLNPEHFEDMLTRLKTIYGVRMDKDLAYQFGVDKSAIAGWRSRRRIPIVAVYTTAVEKRISIDWIIFGEEAEKLSSGEDIDPYLGVVDADEGVDDDE